MLCSEHVGHWLKCFSAFVKTKEKAKQQTKNFLGLLSKRVGSYAISSEKAGRKFVPNVAPLDHLKPLFPSFLIRCLDLLILAPNPAVCHRFQKRRFRKHHDIIIITHLKPPSQSSKIHQYHLEMSRLIYLISLFSVRKIIIAR